MIISEWTKPAVAMGFALFLTLALPAGLSAQSASRGLDERTYIEVVRDVLPSVVNISIEPERRRAQAQQEDVEDLLEFLFERRDRGGLSPFRSVSGSGVVVRVEDDKGYILTNAHVVAPMRNSNELSLTFHQREDGSTSYDRTTVITGETVRIAGMDEFGDLAVIAFDIPEELDVTPIGFADSDKVEIGEHVLALGNPLDLNHTVTRGIVSAKSRFLGSGIYYDQLLQTDAVIQPGNSGGPLVNLDGDIVGINNAIASSSGMWQGISFAIPSNDAQRVANDLIEYGRARRGYLGVSMEEVRALGNELQHYDLDRPEGVLVSVVVTDSPADLAGIRVGDIITEIDGRTVRRPDEMLREIARKRVDEEVSIRLVRLTQEKEPVRLSVEATLSERADEESVRRLHLEETDRGAGLLPEEGLEIEETLGLAVEPSVDRDTETAGLLVEEVAPDSKAYELGLRPGDLITSMNGRSLWSVEDFRRAYRQPIQGTHMLRYQRDGERDLITFDAGDDE